MSVWWEPLLLTGVLLLLAVCVLHSKVSILQLFPTALVLAHVSAIFSIVTEFIHFPYAFVVYSTGSKNDTAWCSSGWVMSSTHLTFLG